MTDTNATLSDNERARCAVVARRLDAAQALAQLALVCIAVTLIGLAVGAWREEHLAIGLAAIALGLVERNFALRIRLDAALFSDLAAGRIATLDALDAGLASIGAPARAARSLDDRIAGCRGLWRRHLAVATVQMLLALLLVLSS